MPVGRLERPSDESAGVASSDETSRGTAEPDALNEPSSRCSTENLLEIRNVATAAEFQAMNGNSAVLPPELTEVAILDEEMPHHELCTGPSIAAG